MDWDDDDIAPPLVAHPPAKVVSIADGSPVQAMPARIATVDEARFADRYLMGEPIISAYRKAVPSDALTDADAAAKAQALLAEQHIKALLERVRGNGIQPGDAGRQPSEGEKLAAHPFLCADVNDYTVIDVTKERNILRLELAYQQAMKAGQFATAITAIRDQSQLAGLLVSKSEMTVRKITDMTATELLEAEQHSKARLIELGYDPDSLSWSDSDMGQA